MNWIRTLCLLVILLLTLGHASAQTRPFDLLKEAYSPYMDAQDPLAFPMKVHALAGGSYKFWRGEKDLFYQWCATNTRDWLADESAFVTSHGDIHFGNLGSYLSAGNFGQLGFGYVDFDESCRLPWQLEIVQAYITLRLTAQSNQDSLNSDQQKELLSILTAGYQEGLSANANAGQILADDSRVKKLLDQGKKTYVKNELRKLTRDDKFLTAGQAKDIYRNAMNRSEGIAQGLEQAFRTPIPGMKWRLGDAVTIEASIKDAVLRTRVGSSGSQGLKKYLVLLTQPIVGLDHDVVLYLKQQIPSAGQRAGIGPKELRDPGQRLVEDMRLLTDPAPFWAASCQIGDEYYWVSIREPWSDELDPADFAGMDSLKAGARLLGIVMGTSHRREPQASRIAIAIHTAEVERIYQRGNLYFEQLEADYRDFVTDPRTAEMSKQAQAEIARLSAVTK